MLTLLFFIHRWLYPNPSPEKTTYSHRRRRKEVESFVEENRRQLGSEGHLSSWTELGPVVCQTSTVASVLKCTSELSLSKMSIEDKFNAAVRVIHSLPKDGPYQPSNAKKLRFYSLYKQATEGKCQAAKPGFWDVVGRAKWEAWNKLGDLSREEAMNQYVEGLKEIVETMSFSGEVEDFLDSLGPFYEFVNLQGEAMANIKEKLDEFSSSNGSSLANSIVPSAENSKHSSPQKVLTAGSEDEEEEEEGSSSDKAEVIVETSTATYESKVAKNYSSQNGNAIKMTNGNHNDSKMPPPAPVHSYSHQNGFVKYGLPNDSEEVLTITTPSVPCKEDLERDIDEENGHARVRLTTSAETMTSVATSGTESEKYYSGDSEPDLDEKVLSSFVNSECYPSTSSTARIGNTQVQFIENGMLKKSNGTFKKSKEKNSPTQHSISSRSKTSDEVLYQTVERINRDVDHILARLRILEAAYAANAEGAIRIPASQQRRRRIFGDLSTQSIAFIVMWPFAVQFLLKLVRWWWRRRRNLANVAARSITN